MSRTESQHGTLRRYNAYGCRCDMCKARKAEYEHARKLKRQGAARLVSVTDPDITPAYVSVSDALLPKKTGLESIKQPRPRPTSNNHPIPIRRIVQNPLYDLLDAINESRASLDAIYEAHPELST